MNRVLHSCSLVFVIIYITGVMLFGGCKEVPPPIDLSEPKKGLTDTTYISDSLETPQEKLVLIEEFSGVKCQNCPQGHDKIHDLTTNNPGQIAVVTYHAGVYGDQLMSPYNGEEDLRTEGANEITDILGISTGIPSAGFDRHTFSTSTGTPYLDFVSSWETHFNDVSGESTPVNIHLSSDFDDATRNLTVNIKIHYTEEVSKENNLTIALTESNIITTQKDGADDVYPYTQNHVLRKFLTPSNGTRINTTKEQGREIIQQFKEESLPDDWVVDELDIVAFVHYSGDTLDVLQTTTIPVK